MPAPNIKSVILTPQTVSTGQEFKITVEAESFFYFDDLASFSWDLVENRALNWDDIDDSE